MNIDIVSKRFQTGNGCPEVSPRHIQHDQCFPRIGNCRERASMSGVTELLPSTVVEGGTTQHKQAQAKELCVTSEGVPMSPGDIRPCAGVPDSTCTTDAHITR